MRSITESFRKKALGTAAICLLSSLLLPVSGWASSHYSDTVAMSSLLTKGLAELVELEVTLSTGTPRPLKLAPSVATVITAEDIEAMGAATLDEALESVPGLHVVPSNFNRLNSGYSMRGIQTKQNPQVLLLLDGLPVKTFSQGTRPDTFKMSSANISRIEIIRGPGSALHGADAFAGTINIVTKDAADISGTRISQRVGSFNTYEMNLQHGSRYGACDVAVNLDYLTSRGDKKRIIDADLQTTLDTVLGTTASLAPGALSTHSSLLDGQIKLSEDNWAFSLWTLLQTDGGNGAGVAQALDHNGNAKYDYVRADLSYRNKTLVSDWDLVADLSNTYFRLDNFIVLLPPGALVPIGADGNVNFVAPKGLTLFPEGLIGNPGGTENHIAARLAASYSGVANHTLRFGTGFAYSKLNSFESKNFGPGVLDGTQAVSSGILTDVTGTPNIYVEKVDRTNWHLLAQDEWVFAQGWELTAGVRYDNYSDFGGTINPRVALVWETDRDLATKLIYGRAFRAPALTETAYKNNPAAIGNPNLKPETIDTYELAFDYHPSKMFRAALNLFAYTIKGLIEFLPDPGQATSTAQNAKDQKAHGFEVEAEWQATKALRLRGNFAYQHSEDTKTGEIVPDAPAMKLYANAHWKFSPVWSFDGQYIRVMDRHRAAGDKRPDIKDYDLVNMTLRRKNIMKHWDLAVAVRNLFDNDAREPSQPSIPNDYPLERRSFWAELRYNF